MGAILFFDGDQFSRCHISSWNGFSLRKFRALNIKKQANRARLLGMGLRRKAISIIKGPKKKRLIQQGIILDRVEIGVSWPRRLVGARMIFIDFCAS